MFVHTCTACTKRQLIFPSQVSAVLGSPDGVVMTFTCWCGQAQSHLVADTAPAAPAERRTAAAAA